MKKNNITLTATAVFMFASPAYADNVSNAAKPVLDLGTTVVTGKRVNKNTGYTTASTLSVFGLTTSLKELPQSMSVITSEQINDQNITSLDNALVQANGISQQVFGSKGAGYNYFFARGAKVENFQLDGAVVNETLADLGNLSSAAYERVEVIKGVAGLLDGTGEPSAIVNLVRKHATTQPSKSVNIQAGSRNNLAVQADVSGSLNADKSLKGRMIVSGKTGDTWRQREEMQAASAYAVLDYDVSANTELSAGFSYDYHRENASASHSTATYDSQGFATAFGVDHNPAPNWAYSQVNTLNVFLLADHYINDDWQGKLAYNFTQQDLDHPHGVAGVLGIDHDTGTADMITGYWRGKPKTHSVNVSLIGKYRLFGRKHDLIMGVNGFDYSSDRHGERTLASLQNIYDQSAIANFPEPKTHPIKINTNSDKRQVGGFIATKLHPTAQVSFILGGRYSDVDYASFDRSKQAMVSLQEKKATPYAGVVYRINDLLSAYSSYSELFIPQSQTDKNGVFLQPVTGSNIEAGLKASFMDDSLNASLAVFETRKQNLALLAGKDAAGDPYYRSSNESKTKGWELDVTGALLPQWQIQAGISHAKNRDQDGKRLNPDSAPETTVKLFTSYDFAKNNISGLKLGAGVRWQSETLVENVFGKFSDAQKIRALEHTKQPSYAVVDVMANYKLDKHTQLSLHVDNVFDKAYRTQPDRHSYGKERTLMAKVDYSF